MTKIPFTHATKVTKYSTMLDRDRDICPTMSHMQMLDKGYKIFHNVTHAYKADPMAGIKPVVTQVHVVL
jgi:hypothetical protein